MLPELSRIDDAIANGTYESVPGEADPLSMFPAERVDPRCSGCTTTPAPHSEHFQRFVLFTNYQRYVDEFIELGRSHMAAEHDDGNGYVRFVEPGDVVQERGGAVPDDAARPRALPQMPAYHLVRGDSWA